MTVMWHTSQTASSIVHYGSTISCDQTSEGNASEIHEVVIEGLEPETQYFYRVESKSASGTSYLSEPATFKTAVNQDTPFAFAVISDTQGNPKVSGELAKLAWGQRPSFLSTRGIWYPRVRIGSLVETLLSWYASAYQSCCLLSRSWKSRAKCEALLQLCFASRA